MSMNYEQLKSQAQTTEKVNKLLAEANEKISCGPDCQELRKRQNLEQIYSKCIVELCRIRNSGFNNPVMIKEYIELDI